MTAWQKFCGLVIGACLLTGTAAAQTYPARPVRVIVPLSAGAVTDVTLRAIGKEMAARSGQPWIIDNRPGAAMAIGAELCAKAPPDGYTLCAVSSDTMSFNPALRTTLPYDPDRDFRPITSLFNVIEGVVGSGAVAAGSIAELKTLAASKSLNVGTLGPGSTPDVFRRWLGDQWKTKFVDVPYKGGGDVATALLSGEIDFARIGVGNLAGLVNQGKVKLLAVSSAARSPLMPDAPTLAETGLGAYPVHVWWGLVAPAATPDAVIAKVNADVNAVIREPATAEFLTKQFLEPTAGTPQEFAAFLKADRAKIAEMIKTYDIPPQ
ncbi:MAG TPA: tripartite tricarboxylate transporter substrate binding protein [Alphaproteobacteria bacterium]|nr:tripartite tricarboxylate transporter substrate binding protein [Alphaproteobacteria bacterium]